MAPPDGRAVAVRPAVTKLDDNRVLNASCTKGGPDSTTLSGLTMLLMSFMARSSAYPRVVSSMVARVGAPTRNAVETSPTCWSNNVTDAIACRRTRRD